MSTTRNAGHVSASTARRIPALTVAWLLLLCASVLVRPVAAAAGWPLATASRVALGFGDAYTTASGTAAQHRGTDLVAEKGARVIAPLAGEVTFVGSVPGVGGGRVTAITIDTARGKVTLLPLAEIAVTRGEHVAEGDRLGSVAADGDGSSAGTHLHVGAREGELYVDPLGWFAAPPAPGSEPHPDPEPVAAGSPALAIGSGVVLAPRPSGAAASGAGITAGELAPGVSLAGSGVSAPSAAAPRTTPSAALQAPAGVGATAADVRPTCVGADGVVLAEEPRPQPVAGIHAGSLLATAVTRVRMWAARGVRAAGFALLGMMAALGLLWPLWRGGGKGTGKVCVSACEDDVAAAVSR